PSGLEDRTLCVAFRRAAAAAPASAEEETTPSAQTSEGRRRRRTRRRCFFPRSLGGAMLVLAVALGLAGAAQPGAAWASSGCEVDTGGTCNGLTDSGATRAGGRRTARGGPWTSSACAGQGTVTSMGCAHETQASRECATSTKATGSVSGAVEFQECREAEECTGRLYGVCRCKNGFCKNEAGDCLASNVPLNVSFLPDSWESMSADEVEQVDGDGKRLVVAVGVALTCALAAVSAAVSFVAARRAWHRTAVSQPLLS
ncbi:unnamed protein product, partial [Prorocentrum cordatum]